MFVRQHAQIMKLPFVIIFYADVNADVFVEFGVASRSERVLVEHGKFSEQIQK